jgi:hypothetical protein
MKKNIMYISSMFTLVFCLALTSFGQETTGNIEGTIKDQAGAIVPNVAVTITSGGTSYSNN